MTSASIPTRLAMPCPFASDSGAALTEISSIAGDSVNFHQGFPSVYGAPATSGGKFVQRGEINAIGNLASNDLFWHKCGMLNTYDAAFAAAVGGYPAGAILDYVKDDQVVKVLSLQDNNLKNFETDGIDNVWWTLCNTTDGTFDKTLFYTSTTVSTNNSFVSLGTYKADANRPITVSVENKTDTGSAVYSSVSGFHNLVGIGILIADAGSGTTPSVPDLPHYDSTTSTWYWGPTSNPSAWKGLYGATAMMLEVTSSQGVRQDFSPNIFGGYVEEGHWYSLVCSAFNDIEPSFSTTSNLWDLTSTNLSATISVRLSRQ